jgi:two-component system sensor histidine kinase PhoQ
MTRSLRTRLLLSVGLLQAVFIGITGLILNRAFSTSVGEAAYNLLQGQLFGLMAAIDIEGADFRFSGTLPEARFSQLNSGLYGEVRDGSGKLLWRSRSLGERQMPAMSSLPGDFRFYPVLETRYDDLDVHAMGVDVEWEQSDGTTSEPLSLLVAEDRQPYTEQLAAYRRVVWAWLGGLAIALMVLQLMLLYWALRPLSRVAIEVEDIEQGRRKLLTSDYPHEVQVLADSLNRFIQFEADQITRQRKLLGDLAHSLKTPMSILRSLWAGDSDQVKQSQNQIDQMSDIIDYQLQRASTVGRRVYADPLPLESAVGRVLESLEKVYRDKHVDVDVAIDDDVMFFGEKGDLTEIIGNLLDNALKWCRSRLRISASNMNPGTIINGTPVPGARRAGLKLVVADDGPGVDEGRREAILQRGVRADSRTSGHGIGLAIVAEIVSAYDGAIMIGESDMAGAEITLEFPAT